jgi:beta-lactamase superfamily II metal-dependent hydrolase
VRHDVSRPDLQVRRHPARSTDLKVRSPSVLLLSAAVLLFLAPWLSAQSASKPLEIYVVDVEGGKADLWVTPSGQTLLIDAGSPGDRDVNRILEVMNAAGVTKLDYLLLTHYHVDHVGGVEALGRRRRRRPSA